MRYYQTRCRIVMGSCAMSGDTNEKLRKQVEQVEQNFKAFSEKLPKLLPIYKDKYALMRNGEIVEICDSLKDAHLTGWQLFEDDLFSVQKITDTKIDLGLLSSYVLNIQELQT